MGAASARKQAWTGTWLRRKARAEKRPAETGGDELQELAETFRLTVERLSSLVAELEAAHQRALQVELEKKRFYRDVIRAVTHGRFELVDLPEMPEPGEPLQELPLRDGTDYAAARRAIQAAAAAAGMPPERMDDLVLAAGEAITNAMKHAADGRCIVYRSDDAISVRVTDRGPGIASPELPSALLMPGYSTKVSLGMGYKMMLRLCDCVWLSTGPEGTTVQMKKRIQPSAQESWMPGVLDRL